MYAILEKNSSANKSNVMPGEVSAMLLMTMENLCWYITEKAADYFAIHQ